MPVTNNSTKALFQPIKVGKKRLQNRIVLAPLTRLRHNPDGVPNQLVVDYYSQRATPGVLLIAEATTIFPNIGGPEGAPGIYSEDQVNGWKKVVDAVHSKQAVIYQQIWHPGRSFISSPRAGASIVSASALPTPGVDSTGKPYPTPKALTIPEIKLVVAGYANAAKNAIKAGFDGVEVHGANGYLVDQFINTSSNKRSDIYGGSIENRSRFALEVVDAIVEAIGPERTAIRFSPYFGLKGMEDVNPLDTWSYLTKEIQSRHPNLSFIHFIEPRSDIRTDDQAVAHAGESIEPFRSIWKGPFLSAGGYSLDPKLAFDIAEQSPNNLVAFGRSFISNPDIIDRLRNGYPLHPYDRKTFYTSGATGYTDYPIYAEDNLSSL